MTFYLRPTAKSYPLSRIRNFSSSSHSNVDFTHCVVGGGVVGLAIAAQLSKRPGTSTLLLERHAELGTETSSRNSEVIHAGLYYPKDSLKTKLCIEGNMKLYEICAKYGIPHRRTGKWIVAQNTQEHAELEKIFNHAKSLDVPLSWISSEKAKRREPHVQALAAILESPRTGIVSSHALMAHLSGVLTTANGGDIALNSPVTSISRTCGGAYEVTTACPGTDESATITTETLINSAGLCAPQISNMLLPKEYHIKSYYAKGTYYSPTSSYPKVNTLIYPVTVASLGWLGTHLTLDLSGRIRFGPDIEWVDDPNDLAPRQECLGAAVGEVKKYLPSIDKSSLVPDYCGIRPKLVPKGYQGFQDFVIREEKDKGFEGFVNCLGIESPGLTSSITIGEVVDKMLYGSNP